LVCLIQFITNCWYSRWSNEWRKKCGQAKIEAAAPSHLAELNWDEQQRLYKPSKENWWCGCPSYAKSAYHICKHLIRLYVGEEAILTNKPPQPHYGQVWRQSQHPALWIAGVHDPSQLFVRDLRYNSEPPILRTTPPDAWLNRPPKCAISELPMYDTSDEEQEQEDDENDEMDGAESEEEKNYGI
jgi:hypothetical protein